MPNFKLKYEDSKNIKADRVSTAALTYIKSNVGRLFFFLGGGRGHPVIKQIYR